MRRYKLDPIKPVCIGPNKVIGYVLKRKRWWGWEAFRVYTGELAAKNDLYILEKAAQIDTR